MFAKVITNAENGICILPVHYLPCISWFGVLSTYPAVALEHHEHYQKGSYRNRCHIAGPQGMQRLSVPLIKGKHQQQRITEVRISYEMAWYAQHWHAIRTAYGSAPYFIHYADAVHDLLYSRPQKLFDLNLAIVQWLHTTIGLSAEILLTTAYGKGPMGETAINLTDIWKPGHPESVSRYRQVFGDRHGFLPDLSILDLLMNLGPESEGYLRMMPNAV